ALWARILIAWTSTIQYQVGPKARRCPRLAEGRRAPCSAIASSCLGGKATAGSSEYSTRSKHSTGVRRRGRGSHRCEPPDTAREQRPWVIESTFLEAPMLRDFPQSIQSRRSSLPRDLL